MSLAYTNKSPTAKLAKNLNNHVNSLIIEFPLNWFLSWSSCCTVDNILQFLSWNQQKDLFYNSFKIRIDLSWIKSSCNNLPPYYVRPHFQYFFLINKRWVHEKFSNIHQALDHSSHRGNISLFQFGFCSRIRLEIQQWPPRKP